MKKYLALLLAVVFCFGCFAACGSDETTTDDPSSEATLAEAVTYLQSLYKDAAESTPRDYDMPAKVMIGTTQFTVTWKVNVDAITIKESSTSGFWTIDTPDKNETEFKYVLTATVKDSAGNTQEISFNRVMPVVNNDGSTELVEGKEYKMYMIQVTVGKVLYAITETQDDKYLKSTDDASKAASFRAEIVDGGYKIYTEIDGAKNYVYAYTVPYEDGSGKVSKYLCYSTENASVWTYKQDVNAWLTTCADGTTYVMGTYSSYETFCISEATYITAANTGVSQFPAEFLENGKDAPTIEQAPDMTPAEVIDAAYELEVGGALTGLYTLTGVITSVDTAYDSGYDNVTVTMVVEGKTDKPIQCFRLKGTGADKIGVGDTITVTGSIINYDNGSEKGKVEFNSGCTLDSYTLAGGEQGGTDTTDQPEQGGTTTAPATLAEQIEAANALANGAYLPYESTITGTITDTPAASSYTEGAYKFTVSDGTNSVLCYYTPVTGGTPEQGDTVTVTGKLTAYNGSAQFDSTATATLTKSSDGEEPETTQQPEQGGTSTDVALTNGMKVVIYNPANKKALSTQIVASYYLKGVDLTISGNTVSGYGDTEIWTVVVNSDGSYSFEQGGKKISMQAEYSSMGMNYANDKWEVISLGDGLYNIKNTVRGNYMEWYASKDNWSTYTPNSPSTDPLFQLSFYVVG